MLKLISWNVNGLRACLGKGFLEFARAEAPDILCLQETKMQPGQAEVDLPGYTQVWHSAEKKGYSGTALFLKTAPVSVALDFPGHSGEGRVITADMGAYYMVTAYAPNSQDGLKRLDYRMAWEDGLRAHLMQLDAQKPVLYCGDLNVAATEIDLKNPATNTKNAGFTPQEREKFADLLSAGFIDTFRTLYPNEIKYSWWSYRFNARKNNAGWRIDYFLASARLREKIADAMIYTDVMGSDHCPVGLLINL